MIVKNSFFSFGLFRLRKNVFCSSHSTDLKKLEDYVRNAPVSLIPTGNGESPYKITTPFGPLKIKIGDFPPEPVYSVVKEINGNEQVILETDELLSNWSAPVSTSTLKLLSPL